MNREKQTRQSTRMQKSTLSPQLTSGKLDQGAITNTTSDPDRKIAFRPSSLEQRITQTRTLVAEPDEDHRDEAHEQLRVALLALSLRRHRLVTFASAVAALKTFCLPSPSRVFFNWCRFLKQSDGPQMALNRGSSSAVTNENDGQHFMSQSRWGTNRYGCEREREHKSHLTQKQQHEYQRHGRGRRVPARARADRLVGALCAADAELPAAARARHERHQAPRQGVLPPRHALRVRVYGDAATKAQEATVRNGESALWSSNHRTRIDWMLLWSVLLRTNTLDKIRIVLKAPLRKIPIFGWAMQHFVFIFLQRKWADDQVNLQKLLPFLTKNEPQTSYLIFPEGTDLSDENLEKSAAFAKKSGLEARKYSLYPRTAGWTFMFPMLREKLSAVYDVTMFYEDFAPSERPSEKSLLSARMPKTIHVYIERIDINAIDNDHAKLAEWMEARFTRKEAHLKQFYEENGKLPDGVQPMLQGDQTAAFSVLAAFWVVFISLVFQYAWAFGWFGVGLGVTVAVAYGYATAFLSGVDGYQIENL